MSDENEWKKAPTEEKVEHKVSKNRNIIFSFYSSFFINKHFNYFQHLQNWKARLEGYEECCKLFKHVDDQKNPIYSNYLGLVKKFVIDSNEVAKDKGLDAVLAFVENVNAAAK